MKTQQDIELMIQQLEEGQSEPDQNDSMEDHMEKAVTIAQQDAQANILRWVLDLK